MDPRPSDAHGGPRGHHDDGRIGPGRGGAEKPMHGYQVISELDARTDGRWRPSAGSIDPTLQQLEDEGLVRSQEIDARRVFTLTDAGTVGAARRDAGAGTPWEIDAIAADDPADELRRLNLAVGAAAMPVAEVGSARSREQAGEILAEARRRLYRLLADDDAPDASATTPPGDAARETAS